jgi:hypothetical protein
MLKELIHPSDEDLLLCADGELPRRRSAQIQAHLEACWACRARMGEIEHTIGDFVKTHHASLDSRLPSPTGERALLKARLAETVQNGLRASWWNLSWLLNRRALVYLSAAGLLLMAVATATLWRVVAPTLVSDADAASLPDRILTPGATRAVTTADICSMDHDEVIRPVSGLLQQKVFQEYGLRGVHAENYEVDYLISPGLGGADDIRNLWPEPRYNTTWNSFVKDQLEDYLHTSVCGGKLNLSTAQTDVASDWISAYKKYFHTEEPVKLSTYSDERRNGILQLIKSPR